MKMIYDKFLFTFEIIKPPTTMLNAQTMAIILDQLTKPILLKYKTNQEIIMALIDFTVENASTGKATPGISHTVRKLTGFGTVGAL